MRVWVIVLAAGESKRFRRNGFKIAKQFFAYQGIPLFWHCAGVFAQVPAVQGLVFAFPFAQPAEEALAGYNELCRQWMGQKAIAVPWRLVLGGETRQDSVFHALSALPDCDYVLVHDAARPFLQAELISRVLQPLVDQTAQAVVPVIPVGDTIKRLNEDLFVEASLERSNLYAAQTPQGFQKKTLWAAHVQARVEQRTATDDAGLIEQAGGKVYTVPGDVDNRKITCPEDVQLLDQFQMSGVEKRKICVGFGYDVHRYGGDKPLVLGGVPIPCPLKVHAHSDGDLVMHALMDAILSCLGAGDIGMLFPDTDPAYAGISSGLLLAEVLNKAALADLRIDHVDVTIIAQTPRITPFRENIAGNLAKLLNLNRTAVNVKATTEEHLGFTGEKKGLKAIALVSGWFER